MADENNEKPKIIVDDDWKTEAQAEKQRLTEEAAKKEAQADAEPGQTDAEGEPREIPPASFSTLLNSLAMQTMMALGGAEDPKTKKRYVDLGVAKFNIDMLEVLAEKTKGNLTEEEKKLLDRAQYDLKMGFVQISQHVQKANPEQEGKIEKNAD